MHIWTSRKQGWFDIPAGAPSSLTTGGLEAVCIQHELDHLDGVLYVDRLGALERESVLLDYAAARARGEAPEADPDPARSLKIAELLAAALPEFARAGLEGARVDAIASAARMNKRLLYHYVGDKAALFDAALDLAYDRILESADGAAHADPAGQGDCR